MNDIGNKTISEIAVAFAGIPANVTMLDLTANKLYRKTATELKVVFAAIPDSVTSLKLSINDNFPDG